MTEHVPAAFRPRKNRDPEGADAKRVSMPRYIAWRLFFTKQNEFDLGYAFVIPFLGLFFAAWVFAAQGKWTVSTAMWSALVTVITTMVVATVPKDRARIMRDRDYETGREWPSIDPFSTPPAEDAR